MARRRRSRKGRMPAGLARYWAAKRGRKSNQKRRRRSARRNQPFVMANPRRRHYKRHRTIPRYRRGHSRRNPGLGTFLPSMGFLKEVTMVATGFYATKISSGFVLPMIGISGDIPRIAVKSVVAFGVSYLGGMFLGARAKESLLLGGGLEVLQDAIKVWVSPFVPALAAAEMESYYQPGAQNAIGRSDGTMGSYYQVGELPSDNYAS